MTKQNKIKKMLIEAGYDKNVKLKTLPRATVTINDGDIYPSITKELFHLFDAHLDIDESSELMQKVLNRYLKKYEDGEALEKMTDELDITVEGNQFTGEDSLMNLNFLINVIDDSYVAIRIEYGYDRRYTAPYIFKLEYDADRLIEDTQSYTLYDKNHDEDSVFPIDVAGYNNNITYEGECLTDEELLMLVKVENGKLYRKDIMTELEIITEYCH